MIKLTLPMIAREVLRIVRDTPEDTKGTAPFHAQIEVVSPPFESFCSPHDFAALYVSKWVTDLLVATRAAPRTMPMRVPDELYGALEEFEGTVCRLIRQYSLRHDRDVILIDLEYRPSSEGQEAEAA